MWKSLTYLTYLIRNLHKRQKWRPEILSVWSVYKEKMPLTYFCHVDMRTVVEIAVTGRNNRISDSQPAVLKLRVHSKYFLVNAYIFLSFFQPHCHFIRYVLTTTCPNSIRTNDYIEFRNNDYMENSK